MMVQTELVAIFNQLLGQQARVRKSGVQATYHCPFCTDKNLVTHKLEIAVGGPRIGSYHCWRCDTKGATFGSLLKKLQAPPNYREQIFKLTGDIRLARYQKPSEQTYLSLPSEFHPMHKSKSTPEYKNALAYLKKRGITREDILRYNIGYCEGGEYDQHVIVPSYDAKGALNFFIGRRYYVDDPGIPHKKPDVPMDIVGFESFVNYNEPLNLCEGVFDAMAIRNNAIPLFGKYPSQTLRANMNLFHVRRVNVVLDWDAESDSMKMYKRLHREVPNVEIHIVKLDGKDPSKLGFQHTHTLIRNAPEFDESDLLRYELQL
jgi:hypothetical protein